MILYLANGSFSPRILTYNSRATKCSEVSFKKVILEREKKLRYFSLPRDHFVMWHQNIIFGEKRVKKHRARQLHFSVWNMCEYCLNEANLNIYKFYCEINDHMNYRERNKNQISFSLCVFNLFITVYPGSLSPFYIAIYDTKWVKTSWTYSIWSASYRLIFPYWFLF